MIDPVRDPADTSLPRRILSTPGMLVGACTTLIGLIEIVEARIGPSYVDEYTALLFLVSALASYFSIRHSERPRLSKGCETFADVLFLVGLVNITIGSLFFACEVI